MLEAGVTLGIAAATALVVLTNRLHNRIFQIDKRVDQVELRVAEQYVSKTDLDNMIVRVEQHLIRLEDKLDKLTYN